MTQVRSIMTRHPLTFSPETTIRDAMEALCAEHLSGAPVVSGHRVVGIVSMTDLLSFLVTTREGEQETPIDAFSNTWEDPEKETEDEDIQELTEDEILDDWVEESDDFVEETVPDVKGMLSHHVVEEVMSTDVISLPSDASVKAAAALMEKHDIHRVLVIDGEHLKGIVSALDIARALTRRAGIS